MNSSVTRLLTLKLQIDSSGFLTQMGAVIKQVNQFKTAINSVGGGNVKVSLNNAAQGITGVGKAAKTASTHMAGFTKQTAGGMRVFGSGGDFLRGVALVRNHLLLLAFAFGSVGAAVKSIISSSVEMKNSLLGLGAIAKATIGDMDGAKKAAIDLSSKGFMSISEAAMGLKNLLATGFSLPQAVTLMERFGDTAAYNRQATFGWGEAVVRTTEGIRLGLSNVADAAGMTKNLGQILAENGAHAADLSKVQSDLNVRMAMYNGIIKETGLYLGNAEMALGTYSGAVSKLNVLMFTFKAAVGDTILPILSKFISKFADLIRGGLEYVKINKDIIALKLDQYFGFIATGIIPIIQRVADLTIAFVSFVGRNRDLIVLIVSLAALNSILVKITTSVKILKSIAVISSLFETIKGVQTLTGAFAALKLVISTLLGPFGILLAVVGLVGGAYLLLRTNTNKAYEEAKRFNAEEGKKIRSYQVHIDALVEARRAELNFTQTKIAAGDASKTLRDKEKLLTDQLVILEDQAKKTAFEISKISISSGKLDVQNVFKQANTKDFGISGIMMGPTGFPVITGKIEAFAKSSLGSIKLLTDQLDRGLFDAILGIKLEDQQGWMGALNNAYNELGKITKFGIDQQGKFSEKEKDSYDIILTKYNELIGFIKERINLQSQVSKITEKDAGDMVQWLNMMERLQASTKEALVGSSGGAFEKALNETREFMQLSEKMGGEYLTQGRKIANALIDAKVLEENQKEAKKALDAYVKRVQDAWAIEQQIVKEKLKVYSDSRNEIISITEQANDFIVENTRTSLQKQLMEWEKLRAQLEFLKVLYPDLANLIQNALNRIGSAEALTKRMDIVNVSKEWQAAFTEIGGAWVETQTIIRQTEQETINQLRQQLQQGTIDQTEYAARVALAHQNAAIQVQNAWRTAGRNMLNSMASYLVQMIQQVYIAKAATMSASQAMGQALSAAFNPVSMVLGLVTAGIGIAASYAGSKSMGNIPELNYENINPSGTSAEERRRFGSIAQAATQFITITPTVSISDNANVWIAAGSVESFEYEVSEMMKTTLQQALNNNELSLEGLSPK
jgi:hypothetical protein